MPDLCLARVPNPHMPGKVHMCIRRPGHPYAPNDARAWHLCACGVHFVGPYEQPVDEARS